MSPKEKERPRPKQVRDKLLKRLAPTDGRISAFDKVHKELAIATEKFEHQGDCGRLGVYHAINSVFQYFTSRGIPPATLEPLLAVSAAIVDAERGASSPIFQPSRQAKSGAPPARAMLRVFQGHLAAITECCVRHCRDARMRPFLEPATIMAAKLVNSSKWPVSVTSTEMREIRERVRQCKNPLSPDRISYDEMTSSPIAHSAPLLWAKQLIDHEWIIVPSGKDSV